MSPYRDTRENPLILVVDDSSFMRTRIKAELQNEGYSVCEANDGAQALNVFELHKPDMVLLDAIMPVMDGFAACTRLRELPSEERTPILMVTSLDDDQSVDRAFEAGATDYITKPIQWAVLRHRVRQILKARKSEEVLNKRLAYEKMVADISFLSVTLDDQDQFLKKSLEIIGKTVGVSRVYVFQYDGKTGTVNNADEWNAPGVTPKTLSQKDTGVAFYRWFNEVRENQIIVYNNIEDIPDLEKNMLKAQGIKAILLISLDNGASNRGYIGFDECRYKRHWPDEDINILRTVAQIIGSTIKRKLMEKSLNRAHERIKQLLASISSIFIGVDSEDRIIEWNYAAEKTFGIASKDVKGKLFYNIGINWDWNKISSHVYQSRSYNTLQRVDDIRYTRPDGKEGLLGISINPVTGEWGRQPGYVLLGADITEKRKIETQLVFSQKMESIGQLAAGIAHEINTPMQYIGDNIIFLKNAFMDVCDFFGNYTKIISAMEKGDMPGDIISVLKGNAENLDIGYLMSEIPSAIEQSLTGIDRVTRLILAMKNFSHPGGNEKMYSDINSGIESTVTISRNEWKYVAEMETELQNDLPLVFCNISEINQVVLNMIVNSVHAIIESQKTVSSGKGKITVKTRRAEDYVNIIISDTGIGIPSDIINRIYDPFFTTKDVGKGTGQGLAIAYNIIVNKHKGDIQVDSITGKGTTFTITLPIGDMEKKAGQ